MWSKIFFFRVNLYLIFFRSISIRSIFSFFLTVFALFSVKKFIIFVNFYFLSWNFVVMFLDDDGLFNTFLFNSYKFGWLDDGFS